MPFTLKYTSLSAFTISSILLMSFISPVLCDGNDWVNAEYVLRQAGTPQDGQMSTAGARRSISRGASDSAKNDPWSITNEKNVLPPSRNPHDYLSWAPYHWPKCDWCQGGGRNHAVHTGNPDSGDSNGGSAGSGGTPPDDSGDDDWNFDDSYDEASVDWARDLVNVADKSADLPGSSDSDSACHKRNFLDSDYQLDVYRRRMHHVHRRQDGSPVLISSALMTVPTLDLPTSMPTEVMSTSATMPSGTTSHVPAQAAAHTSSCTPSPTTSMAPSATWTTCPYVGRDGKVNPDVRTLHGPDAANKVSHAVLYNALSAVLDECSQCSKTVANLINEFFISADTHMEPNMNFGQMVRGPGTQGQQGTFAGVLDLRGLVKICNGALILKKAGNKDWTNALDTALTRWMANYQSWALTSPLGKKLASRPNNHLTFYISQVAAAKIFAGDISGAQKVLNDFFDNAFKEQIAKSGEQPFEAVRTRPFHYRNFNLEGLITNAKLGDQIGQNFWEKKSKYGATIQNAVDFVMQLDPKKEDVREALPHVAAVAAAYGDPTGKYEAYLKKHGGSGYKDKAFWFYDQPDAMPNRNAKRDEQNDMQMKYDGSRSKGDHDKDHEGGADSKDEKDELSAQGFKEAMDFPCPDMLDGVPAVELEPGIFVECDKLRPLFGRLAYNVADNHTP